MTEDAGLKLLAAVEALAAEVRAMRLQNEEDRHERRAWRQSDVSDRERRRKGAVRQAKCAAGKKRQSDAARVVVRSGSQDLQEQDQKPAASVSLTRSGPPEHRRLVEFGVKTIEQAIGGKYPFDGKKDGGIAQNMLKRFGLGDSERAFALAADRFRREKFWRDKGLTFAIVTGAAQALLTTVKAMPRPAQDDRPRWEQDGFKDEASYRTHLAQIVEETRRVRA